jgi:hypothetical protein
LRGQLDGIHYRTIIGACNFQHTILMSTRKFRLRFIAWREWKYQNWVDTCNLDFNVSMQCAILYVDLGNVWTSLEWWNHCTQWKKNLFYTRRNFLNLWIFCKPTTTKKMYVLKTLMYMIIIYSTVTLTMVAVYFV